MFTGNLSRIEVVNRRTSPFDIYIGRGSIWGNPFVVGKHGTREEVVQKYEKYLISNPDLMERLPELRGQRLGCFCSPLLCHGDVLKWYVENPEGEWSL